MANRALKQERDGMELAGIGFQEIQETANQCKENQFRGVPNSPECFQLLTWAVVERDEAAWAALVDTFGGLVAKWVLSNGGFDSSNEPVEYFVNEAFTRLWRSGYAPAMQGKLGSVGQYLHYLRRCVWSAIEDERRRLTRDAIHVGEDLETRMLIASAESQQIDATQIMQVLWEVVGDDAAAKIVAEEIWVRGRTPREIAKQHAIFDSAKDVHNVRRNLLRRLKRHPMIRKLQR